MELRAERRTFAGDWTVSSQRACVSVKRQQLADVLFHFRVCPAGAENRATQNDAAGSGREEE